MQNAQQKVITSLFVEQAIKRKSKHWSASCAKVHLLGSLDCGGIQEPEVIGRL
jgi:hypothetical protein